MLGWDGVNEAGGIWHRDLKRRKIVSEFLKDPQLGLKRLVSMPDRMTHKASGAGKHIAVFRPTVITCYPGGLDTMEMWWSKWVDYMFTAGPDRPAPISTLQKIPRHTYPALTEQEEKLSLPLQVGVGSTLLTLGPPLSSQFLGVRKGHMLIALASLR